jgi:3-phosphoshikimate 1-carboxyvinyltransferase
MKLIVKSSANLRGSVTIPGDKSISHRALMHAALANGASRIHGCLAAGVTEAMLRCLRDLGIRLESDHDRSLIIHGGKFRSPSAVLDCGNSGATIRMLLGALAGQSDVMAMLSGSESLRRRPMKRVIDPLRLMGADILGDAAPLIVHGRKLHGNEYTLPVASAQLKAALLLAAIQADGSTTIHEPGPSRDHSERMLRSLGVSITTHNHTVTLEPIESLPPFELAVPGDISSAAFLLAATALTSDSELTIRSIGVNPTRTGFLDALIKMGTDVKIEHKHEECHEPVADVTIQSSELRGIMIDGDWAVRMIDEFPILAILATQAHGETIVRDAAELRVKESDRIGSLASELRKLGAQIEERPDGFIIEGPTPLHAATVDSHGDHRLAMSLAVAGLIATGETIILNAEVYHESFPTFVELMRNVGASIVSH